MPCPSHTRSKMWRDGSQRVEALGAPKREAFAAGNATPLSHQRGVDVVREGLDDPAEKGGAVQLVAGVKKGDVGEPGAMLRGLGPIGAAAVPSRLRRLEFGANSRRCAGAAVEHACHDASSS